MPKQAGAKTMAEPSAATRDEPAFSAIWPRNREIDQIWWLSLVCSAPLQPGPTKHTAESSHRQVPRPLLTSSLMSKLWTAVLLAPANWDTTRVTEYRVRILALVQHWMLQIRSSRHPWRLEWLNGPHSHPFPSETTQLGSKAPLSNSKLALKHQLLLSNLTCLPASGPFIGTPAFHRSPPPRSWRRGPRHGPLLLGHS